MKSILALNMKSRKLKSVKNLKEDLRPGTACVLGVIKQRAVLYTVLCEACCPNKMLLTFL